MTEAEIKTLIRDYIVEHLDIRVNVKSSYDIYNNGHEVEVTLYLGDEILASDSHSLPTPRFSF